MKLQFDHIFFVLCGQIFAGMPKVLWSKKLSIFRERTSNINGCYCIDCFYVTGHPCKLQLDHWVNLIDSAQGCLGMSQVFGNNEHLVSLEIVVFRQIE